MIVLITDAPPHLPDKDVQNVDEVLQAFSQAGIDHITPCFRPRPESKVYLRICNRLERRYCCQVMPNKGVKSRVFGGFRSAFMTLRGLDSQGLPDRQPGQWLCQHYRHR